MTRSEVVKSGKIASKSEIRRRAAIVQEAVDVHWRIYKSPMPYRKLFPTMIYNMPPGMNARQFQLHLSEQGYVVFREFTCGSTTLQYVFPAPPRLGLSEDAIQAVMAEHYRTSQEQK